MFRPNMKNILLVEDDADLSALVKYNLEKEGYSVSQLQTGKGVGVVPAAES
jgi:DNA-binding response OmpR family regulator